MKRHQFRKHRPLYSAPVQKPAKKNKQKWLILPLLWKGFRYICFALGFSLILSALIGIYTASYYQKQAGPASLPDKMVLYLQFENGLEELPAKSSFGDPFAGQALTVRQVVDTIDRAAMDDKVQGIFARMNDGGFSLAHIQEVRAAIKRFKAEGKFAHIYSSSLGSSANGLGRYYLASAFDEIWMQPLGIVTIMGLKADIPFFREVLNKIGVVPQFYQRYEYKTAYESITDTSISPEGRKMYEDLVEGIKTVILNEIPADRNISPEAFADMIDQGLFTAQEAEEAGLITAANYPDILVDRLKEEILGDAKSEESLFVSIERYAQDTARKTNQKKLMAGAFEDKRPKVALIYAVGAIMSTEAGGPTASGSVAAADKIAPAILQASDDKSVEAIVLRIDSPGGTPVASESILRALNQAKKEGKKIIVSMGQTAASGGYWIASGADQIFLNETTITGSIGVVGGKFSFGPVLDKLGVNFDSVQWGENAGMWSFTEPFDKAEAARVNVMLDNVYQAFLQRVSEGRGLTMEELDKVARGRVWFGPKAVEAGLADQIGGLHEALNYVAQDLGQENKFDLNIVQLPRPKTPLEQILQLFGQQGLVWEGLRLQGQIGAYLEPFAEPLAVYQSGEPALTYDPIRIQ